MGLDTAREALSEVGVSDILTVQLKRAPDAERRHLILEVLGSLGESGTAHLVLSCFLQTKQH